MFKFLVAVIIGGLLNTSVLLAQNLAYELVIHSRGNISGSFVNNIQLACRIRNDSTFDSQAIYWLNATQVVNGDRWTGGFGRSGISFALTRDTEGTYTCGRMDGNTVTRSDPETLIVIPTTIPDLETSSTTIFYTSFGSTATLACPITPGNLLEQYSCDWKKNGTRIATFPDPSSSPSSKHSIDPERFSLNIFNVVGEDDSSQYTCVVKVNIENQDHFYLQTRNLYLTLKVNAPPVIMSGPEPQTVSTSTAQDYATFTCIATGIPSPSITWTHNDIDVPPVNGSKYATFVSMMPRPNDGRIDVTNTLTIKTFDRTDSGNVICNARTSGIRTPVHAPTTIAVLGAPIDPEIEITQGGGVLFILRFATVIPRHAIMRLNVTYMDLNTMTITPAESIREEEYANTDTIYYLDRRDSIPKRFSAMVNIVANISNAPVSGPSIDFGGKKHNRDQPTGCNVKDITAIVGLATVFALTLIVATVIAIGCVSYIIITKRQKGQRDRQAQEHQERERRQQRQRDADARRDRENFARTMAAKLSEHLIKDPEKYFPMYKKCREKFLRIEESKPKHDGEEDGNEDEGFEDLIEGLLLTELRDKEWERKSV